MGSDVSLVADGGTDPRALRRAARSVELVFAREEQRFSRFRTDSELSRVNARAGRWTRVSAGFATLVGFALEAASRTAGVFDPTVLPVLSAGGHGDPDEMIAEVHGALLPTEACGRWPEIEMDGDLVRLPPGVCLDFGGVAKGWTVDLAAQTAISAAELPWAVVSAGGDLRIAGRSPAAGIEVVVEDPEDREKETTRVRITSGALATSSVTAPSWSPGLRHLIDPRTGRPADTGVLQATVWADTCSEAEIRSEEALLEGLPALQRLSAVLVMTDGRIVMNLQPMERRELAKVGA
jgi:FAD:protein FMN transferase